MRSSSNNDKYKKNKSKDFLTGYIKDSKDRLAVIVEEYCSLIVDKQLRLFNNKQRAATTDQNLIAEAAAYTTPELQQDEQAYKRHRLAEEALWLWCIVYCMRKMWIICQDKYLSKEYSRTESSEQKYKEATWDGVVEGVNYSLDHIRKNIVEHFSNDKTKDEKFTAGRGSLKTYVFNMAAKRTIDKYNTIFADNTNIAKPQPKDDISEEEDWIETLPDHRAEIPMDRDDKKFLEIFLDGYKQLEKGADIQSKELKSTDSIDWLADYIENNRKSFEMVIRNIMRRESCESIGTRFGVSKDTVRRRIEDFLKDMRDLIC